MQIFVNILFELPAFPGQRMTPLLLKISIASLLEGIFAPSTTNLQPAATKILASDPMISFCVADGKAIVIFLTSHGFFPSKNCAVDDSYRNEMRKMLKRSILSFKAYHFNLILSYL